MLRGILDDADVCLKRVDQLFIKRNSNGNIELIVAKATDNFILAGTPEALQLFTNALSKIFTLKNINRGARHLFLGMTIILEASGSITASIKS